MNPEGTKRRQSDIN